MRYALLAILVVGLLGPAAPAQAQGKFVENTYWKLDLTPSKRHSLNKLRVGGTMYYYFVFDLENRSETPRKVSLTGFAMTDRLREGVSVDDVKSFNRFIKFQVPEAPDGDTEIFDNSKKYQMVKRYYDRNYGAAVSAIKAKIGGKPGNAGLKHNSEIGVLQGKQKVRAMCVFKSIDPDADYVGIVIKGLVNRIKNVGDEMFMEDRVLMMRYYTPGTARNVDENPIFYRPGPDWHVIKREKITYPMK